MTFDEAKHLLWANCVPGESHGDLLTEDEGFLPSLRPYRGQLVEKNFHLVMEALFVVGPSLGAPQIDRDVVSHLWTLCRLGRLWGVHRDGMLRRNKLIIEPDVERLENWIDIIESTTARFLDGMRPPHAISQYAQYMLEFEWWDNIGFFVPILTSAATDSEFIADTGSTRALGRLGQLARGALPELRRALTGRYAAGSAESWVREAREEIERTIALIEGTTPAE
jgi:hypothetical protein